MVTFQTIRCVSRARLSEDNQRSLASAFRETGPVPRPGRRLLDRVRDALLARHMSRRTEVELELPWLDALVRARRPQRLPAVLTREEVGAVLQRLETTPRLMACLLYGAGLRLLECCRLRVHDVDFASYHSKFGQRRWV